MRRSALLFSLLLLQLPDSTQEGRGEDEDGGQQGRKPLCSWKCLLFTLQWPAGFCQVSFIIIIIRA